MKVKIEIESDEDIQSANLVFTYKGDKVAVKSIELMGNNESTDDSTEVPINDSKVNIDTDDKSVTVNKSKKTEPTIKDSFGNIEHKEGVDESFSVPY